MLRRSNNNNRNNWKFNNNNNNTNTNADLLVVVGTEKTALANLKKNSKLFRYPEPDGFVTRIEYSLLYSMISSPDIYPEKVVCEYVAQEDFSVYLIAAVPYKLQHNDNSDNSAMVNEDRISYAQLSALMALAVQNFPPREQKEENEVRRNNTRIATEQSISQIVCKAILQCVLHYVDEHNLDRKAEIEELMKPVERLAKNLNEKDALKQILPLYLGYAATIVTANPLPFVAGGLLMS